MWTAQMPDYRKTLEMHVTPPSNDLAALRLWNYNKSVLESVKGVKEMEVEYRGRIVWSGIVNRGAGNQYTDYSTVIKMIDSVTIPPV